jgi:hypothetical protein
MAWNLQNFPCPSHVAARQGPLRGDRTHPGDARAASASSPSLFPQSRDVPLVVS